MLLTTKLISGTALVAAAAVGIAVPAYAASSSTAAPSATAPSTRGLAVLGLTPVVIAKAAGTDQAGLRAGRTAGKSLAQIAASHNVSRATLLTRLDATADAGVATLIDTELNVKPPAGKGKNCNAMRDGRRHGHGPRGIGGDVKSLANTLKVTPNVLRADLKKGQTLHQIATANKVSTATLLATVDKDVNAHLARAVDRVPGAHQAAPAK